MRYEWTCGPCKQQGLLNATTADEQRRIIALCMREHFAQFPPERVTCRGFPFKVREARAP